MEAMDERPLPRRIEETVGLHGKPAEAKLNRSDNLFNDLMDSRGEKGSFEKHKSFDNSEFFKLSKRQELARENAEAAVGQLERRLKFVERSESVKRMRNHILKDAGQFSPRQYSCIYVSPIYDDKRGITYRTQVMENGLTMHNLSFNNRRDDEKDIIKMLKEELQKQSIEVKQLKEEVHKRDIEIKALTEGLQQLRQEDLEDERNIIFDKFVDKVTAACKNPLPMNGNSASSYDDESTGNSTTAKNLQERTLTREHIGIGEYCNGSCIVPDSVSGFDRGPTTLYCFKDNKSLLQSVVTCLATLETSIENVCNAVKEHGLRDTNTSDINKGTVEDDLFILKSTFTKLAHICQECGHLSLCEANHEEPVEAIKVEDAQNTINGLMYPIAQQDLKVIALESSIAQQDLKVIALESSCMEKDKKLEDLGTQIQILVPELEALTLENYECSVTIQEMYKETQQHKHHIEELLCINEELLEFSQAKEQELGKLEETLDRMMHHMAQYQDDLAAFDSLLREKDKEIEDLFRRVKVGQIATDNMILEKMELAHKIQLLQQEAERERIRYEELVSINEELLGFAQAKEDQQAYLTKEVESLLCQVGKAIHKDHVTQKMEASLLSEGFDCDVLERAK